MNSLVQTVFTPGKVLDVNSSDYEVWEEAIMLSLTNVHLIESLNLGKKVAIALSNENELEIIIVRKEVQSLKDESDTVLSGSVGSAFRSQIQI